MPTHDGTVTTNMHADTFRILATTENPDEAFTVLSICSPRRPCHC